MLRSYSDVYSRCARTCWSKVKHQWNIQGQIWMNAFGLGATGWLIKGGSCQLWAIAAVQCGMCENVHRWAHILDFLCLLRIDENIIWVLWYSKAPCISLYTANWPKAGITTALHLRKYSELGLCNPCRAMEKPIRSLECKAVSCYIH